MTLPRILVVDDDEDGVKVLAALLGEDHEFEIETATDGETAIASVEACPPDLVLLDVLMPGLNGYDVIRNLRGRPETRDIPILILSGLGDVEERVRGLREGCDDFLSKPMARSELLARIRAHLRLKRSRDEVDAARAVEERRGHALIELGDQRRRLSSTIATDLRAPLTALELNLRGLRRELDVVGRPALEGRLEVLESCLGTLARLTGELVAMSDLPTVRLSPRLEWIAPDAILQATLRELDSFAASAKKQLLWAMRSAIPAVKTDPRLLRQVLRELTMHAVAMSRDKGTVEVEVEWRMESSTLEIAVCDAGVGLPADICADVFSPALSERRDSGPFAFRGAGISFCRMAIESLGGRIRVEPRDDGPGTVCFVSIRLANEHDQGVVAVGDIAAV